MTGKKIAAFLPFLALFLIPGASLAQETPQQPAKPDQGPQLFGGVEPMANDQLQVVDLLRAGKWKDAPHPGRPHRAAPTNNVSLLGWTKQ